MKGKAVIGDSESPTLHLGPAFGNMSSHDRHVTNVETDGGFDKKTQAGDVSGVLDALKTERVDGGCD